MIDPKKEKFPIFYSDTDRSIVVFVKKKEGSKYTVKEFEITYQIRVNGEKWKPVVRFDSPHATHRQMIYKRIHTHLYFFDKPRLTMVYPIQDLASALTAAIQDLKNNWEKYKINYWRGRKK